MAKTFHCLVLKPFDKHDAAGVVIPLSENGFARFGGSPKHAGLIEHLATEDGNGDVFDANGKLVIAAKDRKGEPIDAIAIAEQAKGAVVDGPSPSNRELKPARTR